MLDALKRDRYEQSWLELNSALHDIEGRGGGLTGALASLQRQQLDSGFIKDSLQGVRRYVFTNPDDPQKSFRIQFNPNRALRFKGAGRPEPPTPADQVNDGCFLCRQNIRWQQSGTQFGYEVRLGGRNYIAWMNPFPLLPMHVVFASASHRTQEWIFREEAPRDASRLLGDFLEAADRLPGHIGYFNGVDSGATVPDHFHFHFSRRPPDAPIFPLEDAVARSTAHDEGTGLIEYYPLTGFHWRGPREKVMVDASDWIERWAMLNEDRLAGLTGNLIATRDADGDEASLFFIPRDRRGQGAIGLSERIGSLEVLGEFVFASADDMHLIDEGLVDYFSIEKWLSAVRAPLYQR